MRPISWFSVILTAPRPHDAPGRESSVELISQQNPLKPANAIFAAGYYRGFLRRRATPDVTRGLRQGLIRGILQEMALLASLFLVNIKMR